jgi:hypothetical protein
MRKIFLAGFVSLFALPVYAHEWELLATLPSETLFYDKSSVTPSNDAGDIFTIKASYLSGRSVIRDYELYCKKGWMRIMAYAWFENPYATGKASYIDAKPMKTMEGVSKFGEEGAKVFEKVCG